MTERIHMKTKKLLVATALAGLVCAAAGIVRAQSLAEIARKERAKQASQPKATKVYTNENIPHVTAMDTAASAASSEAAPSETAANPAAGEPASGGAAAEEKQPEDKKKTKEYWQGEFQKAHAALDLAQEESSLADDELSLTQANEVRELDPTKKSADSQDVAAKQTAADGKHAALDKAKQALEELKKQFDESGAPADWLPAEDQTQ
jgi:hypothetical protein